MTAEGRTSESEDKAEYPYAAKSINGRDIKEKSTGLKEKIEIYLIGKPKEDNKENEKMKENCKNFGNA